MGTVEDRWWTGGEGGRVPRERRGSGSRWRARYRDAEGRQRSGSFARKPVRGSSIDPGRSRTALSVYADVWLTSLSVRPSTRRTYDSHLRTWILPALGARTLASITPTDVRGLVRQLSEQLAPSTAPHVHGLLASMLRAAVEDGYVAGARPSGPRRGGARGRRCGR